MNEKRQFKLCERLALCASFVRPGSRIADIGTDHAHLPVRLVLDGVSPRAIASDIAEKPCRSAASMVSRHHLDNKVSVRLGGGLSTVAPEEVDDIIIAGMGGDVMVSILSDCPCIKDSRYRLILQPMSRAEKIRLWLFQNGFTVSDEEAVADAGHNYTVMCVSYTGEKVKKPSLDELYAGKLVPCRNLAAAQLLESQARLLSAKADGLKIGGKNDEAKKLEKAAAHLRKYAGGFTDDEGK